MTIVLCSSQWPLLQLPEGYCDCEGNNRPSLDVEVMYSRMLCLISSLPWIVFKMNSSEIPITSVSFFFSKENIRVPRFSLKSAHFRNTGLSGGVWQKGRQESFWKSYVAGMGLGGLSNQQIPALALRKKKLPTEATKVFKVERDA